MRPNATGYTYPETGLKPARRAGKSAPPAVATLAAMAGPPAVAILVALAGKREAAGNVEIR